VRASRKPSREWINQQVIVSFPGQGSAQLLARLDGISVWGVTLTPMRFSGEGRVETSVLYPSGFYPWERIGSIRLAHEDERM
jgi:hypothetical protein